MKRAIALGVILLVHFALLAPWVHSDMGSFDATHFYFPTARAFLEQGWSFLGDERSIHAPILSWLWPLAWGLSPDAMRVGHAVMSGFTLLMVFRAAAILHSPAAGLWAAALFALSPLLRPWLSAPITEAPTLFLCALWIWSVAQAWQGRRLRWILVGGAALGTAALFRATVFSAIVAIVVVAGIAWFRARGVARRTAGRIAVAYLLALVPAALLIGKNLLLFHFGFFATGGGNALYLGVNPLTGGYDPSYMALGYDVGAIARDQSHLTLEAERLLGGVAHLIYAQTDVAVLARRFLEKSAAFVFVTSAEQDALLQRSWRIATLVLALAGLLFARARPVAWALGAMLAYQFVVHVPALYTHRYSVGALDLWLTIAAGVGIACILEGRFRVAAAMGMTAVIATGCAMGFVAWRDLGRPMPDVEAAPRLTAWTVATDIRLDRGHPEAELAIDARQWFRDWNNHVLVMDARHDGAPWSPDCTSLQVSFRRAGHADFSPSMAFRRHAGEGWHRYELGTLPLEMAAEGTLRLRWACATPFQIHNLHLVAALGPVDFRAQLLHEAPLLPAQR